MVQPNYANQPNSDRQEAKRRRSWPYAVAAGIATAATLVGITLKSIYTDVSCYLNPKSETAIVSMLEAQYNAQRNEGSLEAHANEVRKNTQQVLKTDYDNPFCNMVETARLFSLIPMYDEDAPFDYNNTLRSQRQALLDRIDDLAKNQVAGFCGLNGQSLEDSLQDITPERKDSSRKYASQNRYLRALREDPTNADAWLGLAEKYSSNTGNRSKRRRKGTNWNNIAFRAGIVDPIEREGTVLRLRKSVQLSILHLGSRFTLDDRLLSEIEYLTEELADMGER